MTNVIKREWVLNSFSIFERRFERQDKKCEVYKKCLFRREIKMLVYNITMKSHLNSIDFTLIYILIFRHITHRHLPIQ